MTVSITLPPSHPENCGALRSFPWTFTLLWKFAKIEKSFVFFIYLFCFLKTWNVFLNDEWKLPTLLLEVLVSFRWNAALGLGCSCSLFKIYTVCSHPQPNRCDIIRDYINNLLSSEELCVITDVSGDGKAHRLVAVKTFNPSVSRRRLTCESALRTLIRWVEMNRSTSVRVCASPSALCCKTKYIPGESDWSESTKLDGWDQISTGLVRMHVHACMFGFQISYKLFERWGRGRQRKMLAAVWFNLISYQLSWHEGSELAEKRGPAQH